MRASRGYSIPRKAALNHLDSPTKISPFYRKAFFLSCSCVVLILINISSVHDSKSSEAPAIGQHSRGELSDVHSTWRAYGGAADGAQYSSLSQITRSNVAKLKKVWTYQTGDGLPYAFNPLIVDNVMYVMARNNSIVALDASTGKEIWIRPTRAETALITNRGLDYWESADRSERRLLFAADNRLQTIDARTGQPILDFGTSSKTY
jgi:glucose dehydrogenase